MATVSQIRDGLATNLATIAGLRTAATVPDSPNPPIAIVEPVSINFDTTFGRGLDEYLFKITVVAGRADERSGQNKIDGYCNPSGALSVKTAVESDKTLGGVVQTLRVTGLSTYGSITIAEIPYLAAEFAVTVYTN
jgi:hypothetical protein